MINKDKDQGQESSFEIPPPDDLNDRKSLEAGEQDDFTKNLQSLNLGSEEPTPRVAREQVQSIKRVR